MFFANWTWGSRYGGLGITGYIYQHGRRRAGILTVVDVGCSYGTALAECKRILHAEGVDIRAVGIDPSPKVAPRAELNLDEFMCGDVAAVGRTGEADVVICANVINRIQNRPGNKRGEIFWHAARLLTPGGIMVSNEHGVPPECREGLRARDDLRRTELRPARNPFDLLGRLRKMHVYERV